jgi:hypothetical protein
MSEMIFEPEENLRGVTFQPALDLNVSLDYQIALLDHCVKWLIELGESENYRQIKLIESCMKRAFAQIENLQTQIKIETEIEEDEEDTNQDTEGN